MKKLTADECREWIDIFSELEKDDAISIAGESHLQAYRIALPILEQQERGDGGWIEWGGGVMPVSGRVMVEVRFKRCSFLRKAKAKQLDWTHYGNISDIIAYRITPERATNQNGE
ncbi:hypothetical protein [Pantoea sp. UYEF8]|uniref:hypothetical protein n=1 Tax=Pantoea sp. UYEF8 TaxID=1756394 RepID=UPI0033989664